MVFYMRKIIHIFHLLVLIQIQKIDRFIFLTFENLSEVTVILNADKLMYTGKIKNEFVSFSYLCIHACSLLHICIYTHTFTGGKENLQ